MKRVIGKPIPGSQGDSGQIRAKMHTYPVMWDHSGDYKVRTTLENRGLRRLPAMAFVGVSALDASYFLTNNSPASHFDLVNPHASEAPAKVKPFLHALFFGLHNCLFYARVAAQTDFEIHGFQNIDAMSFPVVLVARCTRPRSGSRMVREVQRDLKILSGGADTLAVLTCSPSDMENAVRMANSVGPKENRISILMHEINLFFIKKIVKLLEAVSGS